MRYIKWIVFGIILCSSLFVNGQRLGFSLPKGRRVVTIPFEQLNNLIVIPVTINNTVTLKFILDTGVQNAILTEKIFGDLLQLEYSRKIQISGPGLIDSVTAYIANDITISLPQNVTANDRALLVLDQDYLDLNSQLGEEVYGIIGYEIFSRFVIKIDYDRNEISLYDPEKFKGRKSGVKLPISITNGKPFISTGINYGDCSDSLRLMIDTGASHALLLDPESDSSILVPEKTIDSNLGKGLGGDITGKLGRITEFSMGEYSFNEVLASFPDPGIYNKNIKRGSRSGTIGGEMLTRVNPIFDYQSGLLYLQKGRLYKTRFKHDMSGLYLSAHGNNLEKVIVTEIKENSPAEKAGLKPFDIIIKVNGQSMNAIGLSILYNKLRSRPGKKINLKIRRDGEVLKKSFRLERFI